MIQLRENRLRPTPTGEACIPEIAHALKASTGGVDREDGHALIAHTLRGSGFDASEDGTGRGTPLIAVEPFAFDLTQITHPENRAQPAPGKPAPALNKTSQTAIAFEMRQDFRASPVASPLTSAGRFGQGVEQGSAVRRLTPLEAERLQGFPDGYTAIEGASDSARYEALGNSMAVPVMAWIGRRIELVDKIISRSAA